jgi:hypothetical protein
MSAEKDKGNVLISWSTASERNNNYFELERSTDAYNWTTVAKVQGAGYSTSKLEYEYTDKSAPFGRVYYRIKQVDFDGEFEYANNVISLIKDFDTEASNFDFAVFPNPSNGQQLRLKMSGFAGAAAMVSITDLSGKRLYSNVLWIDGTGISEAFSCNCNPGMYIVTLIANDKLHSERLVIDR